eukprot:GHVH01014172.1.p1 GENE.GHVH01014172.1~~GHVH01014172.1.p1  ORF type:complete len:394 (-),score=42.37 GHVH01014172.1:535-1716(-)
MSSSQPDTTTLAIYVPPPRWADRSVTVGTPNPKPTTDHHDLPDDGAFTNPLERSQSFGTHFANLDMPTFVPFSSQLSPVRPPRTLVVLKKPIKKRCCDSILRRLCLTSILLSFWSCSCSAYGLIYSWKSSSTASRILAAKIDAWSSNDFCDIYSPDSVEFGFCRLRDPRLLMTTIGNGKEEAARQEEEEEVMLIGKERPPSPLVSWAPLFDVLFDDMWISLNGVKGLATMVDQRSQIDSQFADTQCQNAEPSTCHYRMKRARDIARKFVSGHKLQEMEIVARHISYHQYNESMQITANDFIQDFFSLPITQSVLNAEPFHVTSDHMDGRNVSSRQPYFKQMEKLRKYQLKRQSWFLGYHRRDHDHCPLVPINTVCRIDVRPQTADTVVYFLAG